MKLEKMLDSVKIIHIQRALLTLYKGVCQEEMSPLPLEDEQPINVPEDDVSNPLSLRFYAFSTTGGCTLPVRTSNKSGNVRSTYFIAAEGMV